MTRGDQIVEKGAQRLRELSQRAAAKGGAAAHLAQPLAEDAAFLRKLKPSMIKARARGDAPTDQSPGDTEVVAPTGPQLGKRPKQPSQRNPWLVLGAALAAGVVVAKLIDWRGHAHPKD